MVGFFDASAHTDPNGFRNNLTDPGLTAIGDNLRRKFFPTEQDQIEAAQAEAEKAAQIRDREVVRAGNEIGLENAQTDQRVNLQKQVVQEIASNANALLQIQDPVMLRQKLLQEAERFQQTPMVGNPQLPQELLNMANQLGTPDGFARVQAELQSDMRQAQSIDAALDSRFVSEKDRITEERLQSGQEFDQKATLRGQDISIRGQNISASNAAATREATAQRDSFSQQQQLADDVRADRRLDFDIAKEGLSQRKTRSDDAEKQLKAKLKEDKDTFDKAKDIRSEIFKDSKEFKVIQSNFDRINIGTNSPSAMSDISMVFAFMKMNDPNSVVRESEFATVGAAGGLPDNVQRMFNKIDTGEGLTQKQRGEIFKTSNAIFKSEKQRNDKVIKKFINVGKQHNVSEADLFGAEEVLSAEERKDKYGLE